MKPYVWDPGIYSKTGKLFSPAIEVHAGIDLGGTPVVYTPIKDCNGNELYDVVTFPIYEYKKIEIIVVPVTNGKPDMLNYLDSVMFNADVKNKEEFFSYIRTFHLTVASACVWLYGTNKSPEYEISNHIEDKDYDHFVLSIVKNILRSDDKMHCTNFKVDFVRTHMEEESDGE